MASQKNIALTKYNFIKLEWGVDFHPKNEPSLTQDDTPVMITTSAHITRQLLPVSLSAAFLPAHWVYQYPGLKTLSETSINKPLYAVWLQKNDQQALINQLIKTPIKNAQLSEQ